MIPGPLDHLLAVVIVVVLPLYGIWEFRQLQYEAASGRHGARLKAYKLTMIVEWGLALAMVGVWLSAGRPLPSLGLGFDPSWRLGAGFLAAAILVGLAWWQNRFILADAERRDGAREELAAMADLLPRTRRERAGFTATSVTAGICEELLYRGFLLQYLLPGFGIWASVGLTSLVFGLGHVYQGVGGVLKTGLFGVVMAGLVVLSGSIWPAVALHAAIDLVSGELGWRLLAEGSPRHDDPAG